MLRVACLRRSAGSGSASGPCSGALPFCCAALRARGASASGAAAAAARVRLRRGQVVGERVRDLLDASRAARARPRSAGSPAACSPRPRRAARRRRASGCSSAADDELRRVLLVPVAARVRERPSRRFASGNSALAAPVLHLARGAREPPRPAGRGSGRARRPSPRRSRAAVMRTPGQPVLLPGRRLGDERDEVVEVGALDLHRDAVGERDHPQPPVRVLGGAGEEELLERTPCSSALRRASSRTRRARRSRICRPAIVAQYRCSSSSR